MDFKEIVQKRYAAKAFDGRPIPAAAIDELLELIRFAPSSLNLQPWKIKVIADPAQKARLLPACWNQPQISSCSHLLVLCANLDLEGLIRSLEQTLKAGTFPDAVRERMLGYAGELQKKLTPIERLVWAQCQVYLALANALHGATALGFAACPMTGFEQKEVARILKLPPTLVPTALCPVGYPADLPLPKLRFAREAIVF
jgi:nitroreductase / dihydropteridine reductase